MSGKEYARARARGCGVEAVQYMCTKVFAMAPWPEEKCKEFLAEHGQEILYAAEKAGWYALACCMRRELPSPTKEEIKPT